MSWTPPQDQFSQMVMQVLKDKREELAWSRMQVSEHLYETHGYRISPDEYRSLEQGLTRRVPLPVVIYLGMAWGLMSHQLFPMLDGEFV